MSTRPVTLSAAAGVEAVEGVGLLAAGLYVGIEAAVGKPHDRPSAIALAAFALLAGVGLLFVARALWQGRRWGRAPALLTQIFAAIAGVSLIQAGQALPGALLLIAAAAGVVALFSPPTTHALLDD